MPPPLLVTFAAGASGTWQIDRIDTVIGEGLPAAARLAVLEGVATQIPKSGWILRGVTSNTRYTNRPEVEALVAKQRELNRPQATRAALIPIRKTDEWWGLAQDERRAIFEEQSHHIGVGLEYLPAVARRLHHSRELGEPFDFLTWFEYAPEHSALFEELVRRLRETEEWRYVNREVDIRLSRSAG
jgi:chlorite dismutase